METKKYATLINNTIGQAQKQYTRFKYQKYKGGAIWLAGLCCGTETMHKFQPYGQAP